MHLQATDVEQHRQFAQSKERQIQVTIEILFKYIFNE
jgi:hypothetical protein